MNELIPAEFTDTIEEVTGSQVRSVKGFRRVESAASEEARLEFEWQTQVSFAHPATWTQAEAQTAFLELAARMARAQSIELIKRVPAAVMPVIWPQLQDMAEYEIRMWQVRRELSGPDISERWISLPITA